MIWWDWILGILLKSSPGGHIMENIANIFCSLIHSNLFVLPAPLLAEVLWKTLHFVYGPKYQEQRVWHWAGSLACELQLVISNVKSLCRPFPP